MNLYLHFPFCQQKCFYCDFFSLNGQEHLIGEYCAHLIKEIELYHDQFGRAQIETIYLGGGTPSLIEPHLLEKILDKIRTKFALQAGAEITIEANPDSLSLAKLRAYLAMGINRLSIGVQAWQDELLKTIGRTYNSATCRQSYEWAREAGFTNINLDLMFALPRQKMAEWRASLATTIALEPEHIACYSLEWDNHSAWARQLQKGQIQSSPEDLDRQMYHLATDLLEQGGYKQYEISNFARECEGRNFACRHNWDFWRGQDYLGLGAGSESRLGQQAFSNPRNLQIYFAQIKRGKTANMSAKALSIEDQITEAIVLGLRTSAGVDKDRLRHEYHFDLDHAKKKELAWLEAEGLVSNTRTTLQITSKGQDVLEQVTIALV